MAINILPGDRIRIERDATGGVVTMGTVQFVEYRPGGQLQRVIVRETTRHRDMAGRIYQTDVHDHTTHLQAGMTVYTPDGDILATI